MANVEMIFWDVQHGNALYIKTPNNRNIVVDLGIGDYSGNNQLFSPLIELYNKHGVRTIDLLVITHPHRDHIDDILNLRHFSVETILRPNHLQPSDIVSDIREDDKPKFEKYWSMSNSYNRDMTGTPYDINVPQNFGGIKLHRFNTPSLPKNNLNNHSWILVLEYAYTKIVIPGDNEYASLDLLMKQEDFKTAITNCDILLAPHHGRESAYHSDFVCLANPRISIVSDGSICDTSANSKYSSNSRGWDVYKKGTDISTERKLLTTNSNGEIYVSFGPSSSPGYNSFLNIQIP
jgi:competence protein ComEC